jgi:hypothetical protein
MVEQDKADATQCLSLPRPLAHLTHVSFLEKGLRRKTVGGAWRPRRDVTPAAQSAPTRRATTTQKTATLPGRYRSLVSLKCSSPAPTTSLAYKAPVLSSFRSNELVYPPI